MRNVEFELTRGLRTRVLLVCDNKRKEAQYEAGKKKTPKTSEMKKTMEKEEEEAKRMEKVSKKKRRHEVRRTK